MLSQGNRFRVLESGFFCPCHGSKFDMAGRVFKAYRLH
ncbi:Rieske 2Fe-2S domain-containing protein [Vibrio lentus]|nr:Rieske 2Fe-2S domain-containing protein [Vibrio lentus]